ncbi:hypothetical protein [Alteromonas sp.]|uniref:hypothetical protein n=1 Tax=Alteromonas sp. TaxID=232 RepID=UPI0025797A35|nr:hypothetical protein [Alteromonas sp.]
MSSPSSLQTLRQSALFDMMSDQFNQLPFHGDVTLIDNLWCIKTHSQLVSLDFSLFTKAHISFARSVTVCYDNQKLELDLPDVAKLLWLDVVKAKSARSRLYQSSFEFIALVFAYITSQEDCIIDYANLSDFYGVCLTQNVAAESLVKRMSSPAYGTRFESLTLPVLKKILRRFGIEGIVGRITQKTTNDALNNACLSILDITLNEYKVGGSFNYLGLDIGKHYIDHCWNLFEEHAPFITALRQTVAWWEKEGVEHPGLQLKNRDKQTSVMASVLSGLTSDKKMVARCNNLSLKKCKLAESLIHKVFSYNYIQATLKVTPFKMDNINRLVKALKLPERYDSQEFVRSLLFIELYGEHDKTKRAVIAEYGAVMTRAKTPFSFSHSEIEALINITLNEVTTSLPKDTAGMRKFFQKVVTRLPLSLVNHGQGGMVYFNKVSALIEDAGATCFVGLTGWRVSEYGFPLSSIDITPNPEPLDNYYTPFRFHVRWKVPKTSGETLLEREITLGSYLIAAQLAAMNIAGNQKPAIYQATTKNQIKSSEGTIKKAVPAAWTHFVQYYCLFVDIDRWEALKNKNILSNEDAIEFNYLEAQYQFDSANTHALMRMKSDLRKALPRTRLCLETRPDKMFGKQLALYAEGRATPEISALFDVGLSDDVKKDLKSDEVLLDTAAVRFIRGEFLADAAYPTPHALRHIWAEAVLRRYRGDVGRFIRANFKHIDERFFMAYLRNKEMKAIHQVASRQVINSVVRQQISNLQDDDRAYAGGFDRFLSKAVSITKVYTHEERMQLADKISQDRITAIKSNPWGTCLLRQGTDELAKCSVDGEPQRQNASPSLCLGCLNANVSEGNFNGIVVYTKQDVLACRNPGLPWFIKEPHVRTVNLALKRVKELRGDKANPKYDKFIQHLEASLELAEQSKGNTA